MQTLKFPESNGIAVRDKFLGEVPSAKVTCGMEIFEPPDPAGITANQQICFSVTVPVGSVGNRKISFCRSALILCLRDDLIFTDK